VLEGAPLYGDDVIATLKAKAAYPDGLRQAMVEKHLGLWPTELIRRMIADRGHAPSNAELAAASGSDVASVEASLRRLRDSHALLLHPHRCAKRSRQVTSRG